MSEWGLRHSYLVVEGGQGMYVAHTHHMSKSTKQKLEGENSLIEHRLVKEDSPEAEAAREEKWKASSAFLQKEAKGGKFSSRAASASMPSTHGPATQQSRTWTLQERKIRARKQVPHLQDAEGKVTANPAEMRWIAMDFYAKLYSGTECDLACVEESLHGPLSRGAEPQLSRSSLLVVHTALMDFPLFFLSIFGV